MPTTRFTLKALATSTLMAVGGFGVSWIAKPPEPQKVFRHCVRAVVMIRPHGATNDILGSGFFVDDGIVVTSYHVISGVRAVDVETYAGKIFRVQRVLAYSRQRDFAILKIAGRAPTTLKAGYRVQVGQDVYALGSPMGLVDSFSKGIVSQVRRGPVGELLLQHTAPISPGSSGGPLIDPQGNVVGLNNFFIDFSQNVNFALGIDSILASLPLSSRRQLAGPTGAVHSAYEFLRSRIAIETDGGQLWNYRMTRSGDSVRRPR